MEWLAQISIGDLFTAFFATCIVHETLIAFLPDRVAGPGGWLLDTGPEA